MYHYRPVQGANGYREGDRDARPGDESEAFRPENRVLPGLRSRNRVYSTSRSPSCKSVCVQTTNPSAGLNEEVCQALESENATHIPCCSRNCIYTQYTVLDFRSVADNCHIARLSHSAATLWPAGAKTVKCLLVSLRWWRSRLFLFLR
jgi:hypothetical protein